MALTNSGRQFVRRAVVALSLGVNSSSSAAMQSGAAEACTVSAGPSRRLELADGRIVSVDVKSVAASGGSIMALGPNVYTFPANATPTTSPLSGDSPLGVLIDARGVISLVPSPLRNRSVVFARVAPGPSNSFHVLFVTGGDSLAAEAAPDDTATIWYAQFAGGSWGTPRRIADTRGAALNPEFTSELLARDGSLALVFSYVDGRPGETHGGLVALRRRNGRWTSDTLRTYLRPPAVRAQFARNDTLVVLFSQSVRGARAEDVFVSRVRDVWAAPTRIGGNGVRPVSDLSLVPVPGDMIASWSTWQWPYADTNVLEWERLADPIAPIKPAVIDSGHLTYPFELALASGRHPLWLYQGEPYGTTVTWVLAVDGDRMLRGRLTMPFHNSRPRTVVVSPDRTVILTMKRGGAGEPMIASWMTELRIRCPSTERR